MNPLWLLRAKRWAQNPPSKRRVVMGLVVLGTCAAIYAAEYFGLLPDWMAAERVRLPR